jgi:putative polyhydroxyalkanoate system protein
MSNIDLTYHHKLNVEKCREVVDAMIEQLAHKYSLKRNWDGARLIFNRTGIDGSISIEHQRIHIQIKLGFLLTPVRNVIEQEIMSALQRELGDIKAISS